MRRWIRQSWRRTLTCTLIAAALGAAAGWAAVAAVYWPARPAGEISGSAIAAIVFSRWLYQLPGGDTDASM